MHAMSKQSMGTAIISDLSDYHGRLAAWGQNQAASQPSTYEMRNQLNPAPLLISPTAVEHLKHGKRDYRIRKGVLA